MANSLIDTKTTILPDIRQSVAWGKTLSFVGWDIKKSTKGVQIATMKTIFGSMTKIQRPQILSDDDLKEIEEICLRDKPLFIKIEPNYLQDVDTLKKFGYQESKFPLAPTKTMFINLSQKDTVLWEKLSHSAKYSINRAKREGNRVEIIQHPNEKKIREYHDILVYTGKTKGFYVETIKSLINRIKVFGDNTYLVMVYDRYNILDSAKFYVSHNKSVLYVHGGTSSAGRKSKAGYLLLWESILYFKKLGFEIIDLEGLWDSRFTKFTKNWEGFTNFKEKFNGDIITFPAPYIKYTNPVLNVFFKVMPVGL